MTDTANLTKIHVALDAEETGIGGESMWAEDLGGGRYRLANVPFFAYDMNIDDVIICDAEREFVQVHERSGNCTMRIVIDADAPDTHAGDLIARLQEWGATGAERGFGVFIAVTVPTEAFTDVYERLEELQTAGEIEEWETGSVPE